MTETLRIDEEQGYVDLEVVGALDAEAMRAQIQRVMEAAERADLRRVLVELTAVDQMPPASAIYEMIGGMRRNFRYVLVAPGDRMAAEGVRFVETAAMNSGLAMRIFEDRERGLEWLLAKT